MVAEGNFVRILGAGGKGFWYNTNYSSIFRAAESDDLLHEFFIIAHFDFVGCRFGRLLFSGNPVACDTLILVLVGHNLKLNIISSEVYKLLFDREMERFEFEMETS